MKAKKLGRAVKNSEDQSKTCQICSKSFANGKALGGHLRSHYAKLSLIPESNRELGKPADSQPESAAEESESQVNATQRRSGRPCRARAVVSLETHQNRDLFSEEHGAMCLMMLSRDSWTRKSGTPQNDVVAGGSKTTAYKEESEVGFESKCLHICSSYLGANYSVNRAGAKKYCSPVGGTMIDLNRRPMPQLDEDDDCLTEENLRI